MMPLLWSKLSMCLTQWMMMRNWLTTSQMMTMTSILPSMVCVVWATYEVVIMMTAYCRQTVTHLPALRQGLSQCESQSQCRPTQVRTQWMSIPTTSPTPGMVQGYMMRTMPFKG